MSHNHQSHYNNNLIFIVSKLDSNIKNAVTMFTENLKIELLTLKLCHNTPELIKCFKIF